MQTLVRQLDLVNTETPIVTTIHPLQVVEDERLVMVNHDTPLDWIITPEEVIETRTQYERPGAMNWDEVQSDQYNNIPFLRELRDTLGAK